MIVYAESSAVLSWLFDESRAPAVEAALNRATLVLASRLTGVECARTIVRCASLGTITRLQADALLESFHGASSTWDIIELDATAGERAGAPFPVEPIRSLDAVHLATALLARERFRDVSVLSLDSRVRANAAALGLTVLPAAP